jgi:hypothetical protein
MSYKTLNGARIGDVYMSLIHTCQLNRVNPFEVSHGLAAARSEGDQASQPLVALELHRGAGAFRYHLIPGPPVAQSQVAPHHKPISRDFWNFRRSTRLPKAHDALDKVSCIYYATILQVLYNHYATIKEP